MNKCYEECKPTWLDRLFPAKVPPNPITGYIAAEDSITVNSTITLSLIDRIRVLISGKIVCITVTATEHEVGKVYTEAVSWIDRP